MRDLLTIKHTPAYISVVSQDTGALLWQNAASMSVFGEAAAQVRPARLSLPRTSPYLHTTVPHSGCHGQFNSEAGNRSTSPADDLRRAAQSKLVGCGNFIEMVLGSEPVGGFVGERGP